MTTHPPGGHDPSEAGDDWPPSFPHVQIDALLDRLETLVGDAGEVDEVLLQIAREAQRLRNTVVRLSVARLSAADREARQIVDAAHIDAAEVRASAIETLSRRLDEADRVSAALRRTVRLERRVLRAARDAASVETRQRSRG